MTKETLERAKKLRGDINYLSYTLSSFEYKSDDNTIIDLKPRILIEFDEDDEEGEHTRGREYIPLPISNKFINLIKEEIKKAINEAENEFLSL